MAVTKSLTSKVRKNLASELRAAIAAAPCGMRALARRAGVSHVALARMRQGRLAATSRVVLKVAGALEQWGTSCHRAAKRLRAAARVPTLHTGRTT